MYICSHIEIEIFVYFGDIMFNVIIGCSLQVDYSDHSDRLINARLDHDYTRCHERHVSVPTCTRRRSRYVPAGVVGASSVFIRELTEMRQASSLRLRLTDSNRQTSRQQTDDECNSDGNDEDDSDDED